MGFSASSAVAVHAPKARKPRASEKHPSGSQRAQKYIVDVLSGEQPAGQFVKLAVKRHGDDLVRSEALDPEFPYVYDPAKGDRVVRFIEKLRHVEGRWRGERIRLENWQCFILCMVFGWVHRDNIKRRRFRQSHVEVPRRQGKSVKSSGVGLFMTSADGEKAARVYSCATDMKQARIIYNVAKKQVKMAEGHFARIGVHHAGGNNFRDHIEAKRDSEFWPLAKETSGNLDGLNVSCALVDELHAHKSPDMVNVMRSGMGNRVQPLLWATTTAGHNTGGIGFEWRRRSESVLRGETELETLFCIIYCADPDDDPYSPETWAKCCPNYNVSVDEAYLKELADEAQTSASAKYEFLVKYCNLWIEGGIAWLPMDKFDAAQHSDFKLEDMAEIPCAVALDLATLSDLCAVCYRFQMADGTVRVKHRYFAPESALKRGGENDENVTLYREWRKAGLLTVCGEERTDFDEVERIVREDMEKLWVRVVAVDQWQAEQMMQHFEKSGYRVAVTPQNFRTLSAPAKQVEAHVAQGIHLTDGSAATRWQYSNGRIIMDDNGNIRPLKGKDNYKKMDGLMASVMAEAAWKRVAEEPAYEENDAPREAELGTA